MGSIAAWAALTVGYQVPSRLSVSLRAAPRHESRQCGVAMGVVTELTEETWREAINGVENLAVVEFYAPWCRTCRVVTPKYEQLAKKLEAAGVKADFFKVNFKANKVRALYRETSRGLGVAEQSYVAKLTSLLFMQDLCYAERVFALPTFHFYVPEIGRVNRFTATAGQLSGRLTAQLARFVDAPEEGGTAGSEFRLASAAAAPHELAWLSRPKATPMHCKTGQPTSQPTLQPSAACCVGSRQPALEIVLPLQDSAPLPRPAGNLLLSSHLLHPRLSSHLLHPPQAAPRHSRGCRPCAGLWSNRS